MNDPKWKIFGDIHCPMVWTVDDDWFEGVMAIEILSPEGSDLLELVTQIDTLPATSPAVTTMLEYLKELAIECHARNLSLNVCNFERFESKFAYANRPGNAILLDVYHSSPEKGKFKCCIEEGGLEDVYGIHLLADLLHGTPLLNDIFFVTQYPDLPQREISACMKAHPNDSKWWHLKKVSGLTVNKSVRSLRRIELETFFTYFVRSLPPEPKQVDFDVKFIVLLPVAPMIGRLDLSYATGIASSKDDLSPFLIPMIKVFGLAVPIRELQAAFSIQPEQYKERLARAISTEVVQNSARWGAIHELAEENFSAAIEELASFLSSEQELSDEDPRKDEKEKLLNAFNLLVSKIPHLNSHTYLTLQHWVSEKVAPQISQRIEALLQNFGGGTRLDFAHGTWIPEEGQMVEDLLVIVEFLTKRSKVSREIVEKFIVEPLLGQDAEDATIIQEIPIEGFIYKRSSGVG